MTKHRSLHKDQHCCRVFCFLLLSNHLPQSSEHSFFSLHRLFWRRYFVPVGVQQPFLTTGDPKATDTYTDAASSTNRRCGSAHRRGSTVLARHRSGCWGASGEPPVTSTQGGGSARPSHGARRKRGAKARAQTAVRGPARGVSGRAAVPLKTRDRPLPARARHPRRRR